MNEILLWLVLSLPGRAPIQFEMPQASIEECLTAEREYLAKATKEGTYQASCIVVVAPSVDN